MYELVAKQLPVLSALSLWNKQSRGTELECSRAPVCKASLCCLYSSIYLDCLCLSLVAIVLDKPSETLIKLPWCSWNSYTGRDGHPFRYQPQPQGKTSHPSVISLNKPEYREQVQQRQCLQQKTKQAPEEYKIQSLSSMVKQLRLNQKKASFSLILPILLTTPSLSQQFLEDCMNRVDCLPLSVKLPHYRRQSAEVCGAWSWYSAANSGKRLCYTSCCWLLASLQWLLQCAAQDQASLFPLPCCAKKGGENCHLEGRTIFPRGVLLFQRRLRIPTCPVSLGKMPQKEKFNSLSPQCTVSLHPNNNCYFLVSSASKSP